MDEDENLQKLKDILSDMADLIREAEGTSDPILVADMRQKVAEMDLATFQKSVSSANEINGFSVIDGSADPTIPEDTLDYYRKLFTNFANKVRDGSEKLSMDDIASKEKEVCGIHKDSSGDFALRIPVVSGRTFVGFYGVPRERKREVNAIHLEEGMTGLSNSAFQDFTSLQTVTLPSTFTTFSSGAFAGCIDLRSIDIPEGVTKIPSGCFRSTLLSDIHWPVNCAITYIDDEAFMNCSSLNTTMTSLPDSVTVLRQKVFYNSQLGAINTNKVTRIGSQAFATMVGRSYGQSEISIHIGDALRQLDGGAFNGRPYITEITVDPLNQYFTSSDSEGVECNAIMDANRETLLCGCAATTIPNGITLIGPGAFNGRDLLEWDVSEIPEGVTQIGEGAFMFATIDTLTLPDSIRVIDNSAFFAASLQSINLPYGLEIIGSNAFDGTSLSSISIPNSVEHLGYHCIFGSYIDITYDGSQEELKSIADDPQAFETGQVIHCNDGDLVWSGGSGSGSGS